MWKTLSSNKNLFPNLLGQIYYKIRTSTCVLFTIVCFVLLVSAPNGSFGFLRRALKKVEKAVKKVVFQPVKKVFKEVIEKPVKSVLRAVGLKKVRKTYREFQKEVVHSRVTFTEDSYRAEKINPCPDGQHDIVKTEQPVEIRFEDNVIVLQDSYCRKCGQHFFNTKHKDEL